jgi:hypothetical protein
MKKLIVAAVTAVLLVPALSFAAVLDFGTGTAGAGGTIVDVGGGDAVGINIFIDNLAAVGTSADNVYNLDGLLPCATGGGGFCAALNFDTAAGTFSIDGSVPGLGGGISQRTLVTGMIDSFTFTATGLFASFSAFGTDTKDPDLLAALGIPPGTPFSFAGFTLGFASPVACGEGLTCYTAISTDFADVSSSAPIPEPGTLVLLGGGLIGLARARRRKA